MNSSLLVRIEEKQYGPLTRTELQSLAKEGNFSPRDEVWLEDEGYWVEAEQIEELRSIFKTNLNVEVDKKIIALGSGKGGVGKTVISASLGIGLAALGKEVVLVDADFGGANLHTCMGILNPQYTFLPVRDSNFRSMHLHNESTVLQSSNREVPPLDEHNQFAQVLLVLILLRPHQMWHNLLGQQDK